MYLISVYQLKYFIDTIQTNIFEENKEKGVP